MEITLKEVFEILKKGVAFILITSVIFASCAFFGAKFFVEKTYTSDVKLYVETSSEKTSSSSSYNNYNDYNYAVALVNTYIEMLQTNKFYSEISKNLNDKYTPAELAKMISFAPLNNTEVFKATVNANSPVAAKEVADSIVTVAPQIIANVKTATLKIVDDATLPTEPSAPNVLSITLVAFVAGLILSIIILFVRKVFDIKVTYTEETTTMCGIPVLAAIPDFNTITNGQKRTNKEGLPNG